MSLFDHVGKNPPKQENNNKPLPQELSLFERMAGTGKHFATKLTQKPVENKQPDPIDDLINQSNGSNAVVKVNEELIRDPEVIKLNISKSKFNKEYKDLDVNQKKEVDEETNFRLEYIKDLDSGKVKGYDEWMKQKLGESKVNEIHSWVGKRVTIKDNDIIPKYLHNKTGKIIAITKGFSDMVDVEFDNPAGLPAKVMALYVSMLLPEGEEVKQHTPEEEKQMQREINAYNKKQIDDNKSKVNEDGAVDVMKGQAGDRVIVSWKRKERQGVMSSHFSSIESFLQSEKARGYEVEWYQVKGGEKVVIKESKINEQEPNAAADRGRLALVQKDNTGKQITKPVTDKPASEEKPDMTKPEEHIPPDAESKKESEQTEIAKEYIGMSSDKDHYYYMVKVDGDLQLVDQEGKKAYSAKENNIDPNDPRAFVNAAKDNFDDLDYISRDVVNRYIIPELYEPEVEEQVPEDAGKEAETSTEEVAKTEEEKQEETKESKVNEGTFKVWKVGSKEDPKDVKAMDMRAAVLQFSGEKDEDLKLGQSGDIIFSFKGKKGNYTARGVSESKVNEKELSVPEKHQKKIAISTLKMSDAGANIMGGMNKEEARKFLKDIAGYSDEQIAKLEENKVNEFKQGDEVTLTSKDNPKQKFTGTFVVGYGDPDGWTIKEKDGKDRFYSAAGFTIMPKVKLYTYKDPKTGKISKVNEDNEPIKVGDEVIVNAGRYKNAIGKVTKLAPVEANSYLVKFDFDGSTAIIFAKDLVKKSNLYTHKDPKTGKISKVTIPEKRTNERKNVTDQQLEQALEAAKKDGLDAANEILHGFGIESVSMGDDELRYVNMGDTYDTTICQEDDGEPFIGSWGDWYETAEQEYETETGTIRCGNCGEFTPIGEDEDWRDVICQSCGKNVAGDTPIDEKKIKEEDNTDDNEGIDEPTEPQEDDIVWNSNGEIVAGGKVIGKEQEYDEFIKVAREWTEQNNWYPTIWMQSDHGNFHIMHDAYEDIRHVKDDVNESTSWEGKGVKLILKHKVSTGEWVVRWYDGNKYNEEKTYYTDDKQDAIDTMEDMKKHIEAGDAGYRANESLLKANEAGRQIGFVGHVFNSKTDRNGNRYWAMSVERTSDGASAYGQVCGGEGNCTYALRKLADKYNTSYTYSRSEMGYREFHRQVNDWPYLGCRDDEIIPNIEKQFEKSVAKPEEPKTPGQDLAKEPAAFGELGEDKITHLQISPNEKVTLCGRFGEGTRDKSKVTCKDCLKQMKSDKYSVSQFVPESKKLLEMEVDDGENKFDVNLEDDGTMDTVISVNGREFRFDADFASMWRTEDGEMTEEGLKELALDALSNMEPEDYDGLVNKNKDPESELDISQADKDEGEFQTKDNVAGKFFVVRIFKDGKEEDVAGPFDTEDEARKEIETLEAVKKNESKVNENTIVDLKDSGYTVAQEDDDGEIILAKEEDLDDLETWKVLDAEAIKREPMAICINGKVYGFSEPMKESKVKDADMKKKVNEQEGNFKSYDTWLPKFNGFYGSGLDEIDDIEWQLWNDPHTAEKNFPEAYDWVLNNIFDYIDFGKWHEAMAESICDAIGQEITSEFPFVREVKFQKMTSPREYNFYNDSIDVEMVLDLDQLLDTCVKDPKFADYLADKYTPRSGFIPYHPDNVDEWVAEIKEGHKVDHKIGAMLDFLMGDDDKYMDDIYEAIHEDFVTEYIDYAKMTNDMNEELGTTIKDIYDMGKSEIEKDAEVGQERFKYNERKKERIVKSLKEKVMALKNKGILEMRDVMTDDDFQKELDEALETDVNLDEKEIKSKKTGKKLKAGAAVRHRGTVVFPANSSKVKDQKDHFPINNKKQAANALSRAGQTEGKAPKWYSGSYSEFRNAVRRAVKKAYPSIEVKETKKEEPKTNTYMDPQLRLLDKIFGRE